MSPTSTQPLQMSSSELDELFASSPAGAIPEGRGTGTVVVVPGTRFTKPLAAVARAVLWQGKSFRPGTHDLLNYLSPFGRLGIRAMVRQDKSLIDGRPCIVLDYSETSRAARKVRDEIRQIGPHEYLGLVYKDGRKLKVYFLLSFATAGEAGDTAVTPAGRATPAAPAADGSRR